jgi:hypothetical protein
VENIQVEVTLSDSDGGALATAAAWTALPVIAPGESAPFALLFNQLPSGFAQPVTAVIGGQTVNDLGSRYLDLAVENPTLTTEDNRALVEGKVVNGGKATAVNISLVATFYDRQGHVTGYRELHLPGPLPPGETLPFTIEATLPGGHPVTFHLTAQGLQDK